MAAHPKTHDSDLADGTRAKLLDAAGQVFAESGFQAATVREICTRAGVNVALVNYHFGDKRELYEEVLRYSIGSTKNEAKVFDSDLPPEEALRELILATLQRMCRADRPGWHFRLMVHELAQPTPAMKTVINETMRPMYDRFRDLIGEMLGLSPDADKTRLCTHSVLSQVVDYAKSRNIHSNLWPELELTPARIAQIADHITEFSLAYLCRAPQSQAPQSEPGKTARKKTK